MDSANFPAGSSVITPLLTEVVNIILSVLNDKKCKIYLFGSWAAGTASQGSDIDIAIDIGSSINNSLFRDIKDKVENIRTLRSIDIVDLGEVDNNFRNRILRDGKLLNT